MALIDDLNRNYLIKKNRECTSKGTGNRAVDGKVKTEGGSVSEVSAVFYDAQHIKQPSAGVLVSGVATIHVKQFITTTTKRRQREGREVGKMGRQTDENGNIILKTDTLLATLKAEMRKNWFIKTDSKR